MTAARLTGALLARKGQAQPCGGLGTPSIGLAASSPADATLARRATLRRPLPEIVVAPASAAATSGTDGSDGDLVHLTVRIDRAMRTRLRVLAARQQRTSQDIVSCALDAYLRVFDTGCACVGAKPKS